MTFIIMIMTNIIAVIKITPFYSQFLISHLSYTSCYLGIQGLYSTTIGEECGRSVAKNYMKSIVDVFVVVDIVVMIL